MTAAKLRAHNIATVASVAALAEDTLVSLLGRAAGRHLHALAHNRDYRPVSPGRRRSSIGSQRALGRSPRSFEEIDAILSGLVDRVTRRMRTGGRVGRTIVLRLRFDDFTRATRSQSLPQATAHTPTILGKARRLLTTARPMIARQGLTLVGVSVSNLQNHDREQLALPLDRQGGGDLDAAADLVRERFGSNALTRGALVGKEHGLSVPLLPECAHGFTNAREPMPRLRPPSDSSAPR